MIELAVTQNGFLVTAGEWLFALWPVRRCVHCGGDRPVLLLPGDVWQCRACNMLHDPRRSSC